MSAEQDSANRSLAGLEESLPRRSEAGPESDNMAHLPRIGFGHHFHSWNVTVYFRTK